MRVGSELLPECSMPDSATDLPGLGFASELVQSLELVPDGPDMFLLTTYLSIVFPLRLLPLWILLTNQPQQKLLVER